MHRVPKIVKSLTLVGPLSAAMVTVPAAGAAVAAQDQTAHELTGLTATQPQAQSTFPASLFGAALPLLAGLQGVVPPAPVSTPTLTNKSVTLPTLPAPTLPTLPAPTLPKLPAPTLPALPAPTLPKLPAPTLPTLPAGVGGLAPTGSTGPSGSIKPSDAAGAAALGVSGTSNRPARSGTSSSAAKIGKPSTTGKTSSFGAKSGGAIGSTGFSGGQNNFSSSLIPLGGIKVVSETAPGTAQAFCDCGNPVGGGGSGFFLLSSKPIVNEWGYLEGWEAQSLLGDATAYVLCDDSIY